MPRGYETFSTTLLRNRQPVPANGATVTYTAGQNGPDSSKWLAYVPRLAEVLFEVPRFPMIGKVDMSGEQGSAATWQGTRKFATITILSRVNASVPAFETMNFRVRACIGAGKPWSNPPAGLVQYFTDGTGGTREAFLAQIEAIRLTPAFLLKQASMEMNAGWAETAAVKAAWLALQPDQISWVREGVTYVEEMQFRKTAGVIHMSACALAGHNRVMGFYGPNGHHAEFEAGLADFEARVDAISANFSNPAIP